MLVLFTDTARRVLGAANSEAKRLDHDAVGTEHLLLGLIQEESGISADVLRNAGVDPGALRNAVEAALRPGSERLRIGYLPQTAGAKKVIEHAVNEARLLAHGHIGTEHLLLGLLHGHDVAGRALASVGLTLDEVRRQVASLAESGGPSTTGPADAPERGRAAFEATGSVTPIAGWAPAPFTDRARTAMALANQEAIRRQHECLTADHIFLGLVSEGGGLAGAVLQSLNVDLNTARRLIEGRLQAVTGGAGPERLSEGWDVVVHALEESRRLGHQHVGTEHLLLGVLHKRDCACSQVLGELGVDLAKARAELVRALNG